MNLSDKPTFFSRENKLLVPIVIVSTSIVILGISSQILIESFLQDLKSDANYTGLVRKQRAISQEIIKDVVSEKWVNLSTGESTDSLLNIISEQNKILYTGDNHLNVKTPDKELIPTYNKMISAFKEFANTLETTDTSKNAALSFLNLINKQQNYSREIDNYAGAIAEHNNNKVDEFYLKIALLMIARVAIVSLEVFFIFLPAVKKIQKQNNQLKAIAYHQSHIVRSPICSIIGTLSLVAESEEEEKEKLISMATMEAERLDNIIKETVSLAYDA